MSSMRLCLGRRLTVGLVEQRQIQFEFACAGAALTPIRSLNPHSWCFKLVWAVMGVDGLEDGHMGPL